MRALSALLLPLLCLSACADDGGADPAGAARVCQMSVVAELPVLSDKGSPLVQASINGTKVAFIVDTGARTSIVFEQAAERLGLPTDSDGHHLLTGIGGSVFSRIVTIDNFSLGTAASRHQEFDSIPGMAFGPVAGIPVVGLFGGDFLSNYDVSFDLPHHLVTMFDEHHCSDNLRPWPQGAFYRMPFQLEHETAVSLEIAIDGHKEPVILDSGAPSTVIDTDAGNDSGATRATMQNDRHHDSYGIDGNAVMNHRHRFDTLDIGPEHFAPAYLDVADIEVPGLLGADFLRARKVWISYPHQVIYVQRVLFPRPGAPSTTGSAGVAGTPRH